MECMVIMVRFVEEGHKGVYETRTKLRWCNVELYERHRNGSKTSPVSLECWIIWARNPSSYAELAPASY